MNAYAESTRLVSPYRVTEVGPVFGRSFARRLAASLDKARYSCVVGDTAPKLPDHFTPEVAYRLWNGPKSVTIAICFRSSTVDITAMDEHGQIAYRWLQPFETQRRQLKQLTNEALGGRPSDSA